MGWVQPHCRGNRSQWHRINHLRLSVPLEEKKKKKVVKKWHIENRSTTNPGITTVKFQALLELMG